MKKNSRSLLPGIIVELKWDKTVDTAINQYEGALKDFVGEIILVGINYDKTSKNISAGYKGSNDHKVINI